MLFRSNATASERRPFATRFQADRDQMQRDSARLPEPRRQPARSRASGASRGAPSGTELVRARDAGSFRDVNKLIGGDSAELFNFAERPSDLNVRGRRGAQSKMKPAVIHRQVRGLAHYFLRLDLVSVAQRHPCANRAAIRFNARQLDLDPVIAAGHIVAKERRRLVVIDYDEIDVAVVSKSPNAHPRLKCSASTPGPHPSSSPQTARPEISKNYRGVR